MSAYAALVSLLQLLESTILDAAAEGSILFKINNRDQLQPLHEKVKLLLEFLDEPSAYNPNRISPSLEARMRDAAYGAEDLIQARKSVISVSDVTTAFVFFFVCFFLVFSNWIPVSPERVALFVLAVFVVVLVSAAACTVCGVGFYLFLAADLSDSRARLTLGLSEVLSELAGIVEEARGDNRKPANKALLSLRGIVESAMESGVSDNKSLLESLHEKVKFLLKFQENAYTRMTSAQVRSMEEKTKAAVSAVERRIMDQSDRKRFRTLIIYMLLVLLSCVSALATDTIPFLFQPLAVWVIVVIVVFVGLVLGTSASEVWAAISNPTQENRRLCKVIDDLSIIVRNVETFLSPSSSSSPKKDNLGGKVVGLEGDIKEIRVRLCERSSKRKVVSIVGMGGIGKTTLATQLYNDPYVAEFFDIRAWVTISQEYSKSDVLLGLLKSVKGQTEQMQEKEKEEDPGTSLHKTLYRRRYLIVMDDVWETTIWDFLSRLFPDNINGSRVLLTSRLSAVAKCASSGSHCHEMRCLDKGQSWQLLCEKVFGERGCPFELESIGKKIAKGCRGLPLAIVVIGGFLSKEGEQSIIWENVAKNLKSGRIRKQYLKILGLSYKHLPYHLRPCFLYFGAFSRDSEISAPRLINLWIAEGFLKPSSAKSLEEEAEGCLKDLVDRNLILERTKGCNGRRVKVYGIHDLLRDVCVENARKENFFLAMNVSEERPHHAPRRLSIQPDALQDGGRGLSSSYPNLRSFVCTSVATPAAGKTLHSQSRLYLNFRYLRVLDILVLHFGEFPVHIVSLVCLRYLAVHCDSPLPSSISKLRNLETLVHHHCSLKVHPFLPRVIWDMPNLRYIYVKPGCYLSDPRRVNPFRGKGCLILEHLQTLVGIRNFMWSKDILKRIPNLKKLGISYHVSSSVDWSLMYELKSLAALEKLESLKIVIEFDGDGASTISSGPPKLMFPQSLKKLSLSGCRIGWDSFGSLQNLEVLKLRNKECSDTSWEKVEGFPKLIFLHLENMSFSSWEPNEDHFPRLQRLVVRKCWMLEEIPFRDISYTLETIEFDDCPYAESIELCIKEAARDMGADIRVIIK